MKKLTICLLSIIFGMMLAIIFLGHRMTIPTSREVVTNWMTIAVIKDGSNTFDVMRGCVWTNYILRAHFEGGQADLVLRSEPGPKLTNFSEMKYQPGAGPGPVWTVNPPMPPKGERP
jgi:hypothetical protein